MVAPAFLVPMLAELADHGVPLTPLFRGLELSASDFDVPGTVLSHRDAMTVVRRALQLLPLDDRGLAVGQRARITERGALALGQLSSATLGDAISLAVRFSASAGCLLQVHEQVVDHGRQLVAQPFPGDQDLQHFLVDLTFAATVQVRRQITLAKYTPMRVELVRDAPPQAEAYESFFGCPVQFGCQRNALTTSSHWLASPLPWARVMACSLSLQLLEREAERFSAMPAVGFSVERAIRRHLPQIADLAQVAASLNMSTRTLRRHLAQMGLSYRQLLDESRKARAFDLMTSGQRPISELAAATGFSDPRAFTRAFRRWTGRAPTQVRDVVAATRPELLADPDD